MGAAAPPSRISSLDLPVAGLRALQAESYVRRARARDSAPAGSPHHCPSSPPHRLCAQHNDGSLTVTRVDEAAPPERQRVDKRAPRSKTCSEAGARSSASRAKATHGERGARASGRAVRHPGCERPTGATHRQAQQRLAIFVRQLLERSAPGRRARKPKTPALRRRSSQPTPVSTSTTTRGNAADRVQMTSPDGRGSACR